MPQCQTMLPARSVRGQHRGPRADTIASREMNWNVWQIGDNRHGSARGAWSPAGRCAEIGRKTKPGRARLASPVLQSTPGDFQATGPWNKSMNKQSINTKALLLAGFLAGGMVVSAAFAGLHPHNAKGGQGPAAVAAAAAPAAGNPKVSPYTIANRRHAEASAAVHAPAKSSSARRFPPVAVQGEQH
jgi:hypothetical protein